jgi:endonuclease/exonuclease/phosphatase family metal-dependent hydrolase
MIRLALPLLACVAAALCVPAADPPAAPATKVPGAAPVRVMSFNIRYGTAKDGENAWDKRKEFLAQTVAAFDPDLLGTQETLAFQRDFLAAKLPGYAALAAGRDDGKDAGEMAAVFYRKDRFEKLDGGHFWLSETPERPGSKGWDAQLPRVATWVKLKDRRAPDGEPVLFLNAHLDHRGEKARAESARLIRTKLAELGKGCRLVVTGDFNAGEGSPPYAALFGKLGDQPSPVADTFRAAHPARGKQEGTFTGFKVDATGGGRIDWIGCSRDWDVRLAGIDRTSRGGRTPSDHFPVTAVLRAAEPGRKPTFRVLCYNVHHCEGTDGKLDLARIAKVIRGADPDLVAIQELDDRTKRTDGVDQTAELARLTGLHARFGKAIDFQGGGYGQAVLSRFPIREATVHPLPGMPNREKRIAFEARLTLDGRDLSFVTAHLDHQLAAERRRQAAKLNDLFAGADRPVILAGDLNATPDSEAFAALTLKWSDATAGKGLLTIPVEKPTKQIDYVLFRPAGRFRVVGAAVIGESVASDHRPVLVVLEPRPE